MSLCSEKCELETDLETTCMSVGSNATGVNEITQGDSWRRAPGRNPKENQELRVEEDY